MVARRYAVVDVFGTAPLSGNPVAVVVDGEGVTDAAMQAFARWTNLSETTFLLSPTPEGRAAGADYRLRIWTPGGELPFAGHPTLGSAHAWLASGGVPARDGAVVQECGIGLVTLARSEHGLAFEAPELLRGGEVEESDLIAIAAALRLPVTALLSSAWVDNGPGWVAVELVSAEAVLALEPDFALMGAGGYKVGVFGRHPSSDERLIEVRAFVPGLGVPEDPVTGSLNAGIARWLVESGRVTGSYLAGQGHALGRAGLVRIDVDEAGTIRVGGATLTTVSGTVDL